MDFLHTLLPVLGLLVVAAQGVAHAWITLQHKPDHSLLIDSIAKAIGTANGYANSASPAQVAAAPDAGSTP